MKSASTSSWNSYASFVGKQGPGPSGEEIAVMNRNRSAWLGFHLQADLERHIMPSEGFTRMLGGQGTALAAFQRVKLLSFVGVTPFSKGKSA